MKVTSRMWLISELHKDGTITGKDYEKASDCIQPLIYSVHNEDVADIFIGRATRRTLDSAKKPTYLIIYRWSDGDESLSCRTESASEIKQQVEDLLRQRDYLDLDKKLVEILYINLIEGKTEYDLQRTTPLLKGSKRWRLVEEEDN